MFRCFNSPSSQTRNCSIFVWFAILFTEMMLIYHKCFNWNIIYTQVGIFYFLLKFNQIFLAWSISGTYSVQGENVSCRIAVITYFNSTKQFAWKIFTFTLSFALSVTRSADASVFFSQRSGRKFFCSMWDNWSLSICSLADDGEI